MPITIDDGEEVRPLFDVDLFKNASGKVFTKALFYELSYSATDNCFFTLKEKDITVEGKLYRSLRKLYLSFVPQDPTEYLFAKVVFGDWETWSTIRRSPTILPYVIKWNNEANVKIKSDAIRSIALEAQEGGRNSFQAAKLLLNKGWMSEEQVSTEKQKDKRQRELEEDIEVKKDLMDDATRLGLTLQ